MGVYNIYGNVQIKIGDVFMKTFKLGDQSELPDGVYIGYEGVIVIHKGIFIAEFEHVHNKWGDGLKIDINNFTVEGIPERSWSPDDMPRTLPMQEPHPGIEFIYGSEEKEKDE